jgi:hypothetical protein
MRIRNLAFSKMFGRSHLAVAGVLSFCVPFSSNLVLADDSSAESISASKAANLYKVSPMGSIVINSTPVSPQTPAPEAMKKCEGLRAKFEASAPQGEAYECKLEALPTPE